MSETGQEKVYDAFEGVTELALSGRSANEYLPLPSVIVIPLAAPGNVMVTPEDQEFSNRITLLAF
jgi:hypothetical protein